MKPLTAACAAVLLATAACAQAQMYPGRDRGGFLREDRERKPEEPKRPRPAEQPLDALEREMPSLQVDLQLEPAQLDAWRAFERGVRNAAEIGRAQRRRTFALANGSAAPSAPTLIGALADDERAKAQAVARVRTDLDTLYALLDEGQRRMLDRRIVQSQTDPLGR